MTNRRKKYEIDIHRFIGPVLMFAGFATWFLMNYTTKYSKPGCENVIENQYTGSMTMPGILIVIGIIAVFLPMILNAWVERGKDG